MKTEDIQFKLEEIKFHLELLYAIEESGKSLTLINNPEKEASYLVSAVLNAFYSLTEMCGGKGNQYVKNLGKSIHLFMLALGKVDSEILLFM